MDGLLHSILSVWVCEMDECMQNVPIVSANEKEDIL